VIVAIYFASRGASSCLTISGVASRLPVINLLLTYTNVRLVGHTKPSSSKSRPLIPLASLAKEHLAVNNVLPRVATNDLLPLSLRVFRVSVLPDVRQFLASPCGYSHVLCQLQHSDCRKSQTGYSLETKTSKGRWWSLYGKPIGGVRFVVLEDQVLLPRTLFAQRGTMSFNRKIAPLPIMALGCIRRFSPKAHNCTPQSSKSLNLQKRQSNISILADVLDFHRYSIKVQWVSGRDLLTLGKCSYDCVCFEHCVRATKVSISSTIDPILSIF
jgi:hypothetical protein